MAQARTAQTRAAQTAGGANGRAQARAPRTAERGLKRRDLMIWGGAAAIVAGFVAPDLNLGCGFFQRGGAALVIYAVLVSILSMRARAEYGDELNAIQLEQCEIAQLMYAAETEPQEGARRAAIRQLEPKLKALDGRLAHLAESGQRFQDLRLVEGPILIIGTLIWGFGDMWLRTPGCAF